MDSITEDQPMAQQVDESMKIDSTFDIFIPKLVQTTNFRGADATKSCPGCGETFKAKLHKHRRTKLIPVIAFYDHCLKKCLDYRALGKCVVTCCFQWLSMNNILGLHRRCWKCRKLFMGETNYIYHLRSYKECKSFAARYDNTSNVDPMPCEAKSRPGFKKCVAKKLFDDDLDQDVMFACPGGCGHREKSANNWMTPAMILHVIKCPQYHLLETGVATCDRCILTFPDSGSFNFHREHVCPYID